MNNKSNVFSIGDKVVYCYDETYSFRPAPCATGTVLFVDTDGDVFVKWDKPIPEHSEMIEAFYRPDWVKPISIGGF